MTNVTNTSCMESVLKRKQNKRDKFGRQRKFLGPEKLMKLI